MENRFTENASQVLNNTLNIAMELKSGYIGSEHLLVSILSNKESVGAKILSGKGIDREKIYDILLIREDQSIREVTTQDMSPRLKRIIERSATYSAELGFKRIGTEHILYSLLEERDCVAVNMLISCGLYVNDLLDELKEYFEKDGKAEAENVNRYREYSSAKTPTLSKYATDLTMMARMGKMDPVIGRDRETNRVIQILTRRSKNNPCLIGEPGVGKTAVVEGLAKRIAENQVPELLKNKMIFRLDLSSMIAGAKYRGEFEERMKSVMEEVQRNRDVILFIDEIHTIVGAGAAEGAVDAANIMKPALARAQIQVIGATTFREFQKYIEKDAALERRFQPVTVEEPTPENTVLILKGLRDKLEKHHHLTIGDDAIEAAISMSIKYIPDRFLPDKAIDLLDEAAAKKRIDSYIVPEKITDLENQLQQIIDRKENEIKHQHFEEAALLRDQQKTIRDELSLQRFEWEKECSDKKLSIEREDIAKIVTSWTGIPVSKLAESDADRILKMESELQMRVIGQEDAVKTVCDTIKRTSAGLSDPTRPLGSFLFLGPTGVGKTELAKAVSQSMFGSENAMIRLDMSEYMEKQSISRLIGSAPGYIGYDEGGQLTERVRRRPYSLILLDEIEKAHPDLFNALLQILEDGKLSDSKGRSVNFKNTVIIMTSNIGAEFYGLSTRLGFGVEKKDIGREKEETKRKIESKLGTFFSPEFLNRIDETVYFNQLTFENVKRITLLLLSRVKEKLMQKQIHLIFDTSVTEYLAEKGYDVKYGARPLRRIIRRMVEDEISILILKKEVIQGDTIECALEDDQLVFRIDK